MRAAIPFLERAAEAGQPEAQHMLATLHRDGIGVSRDARKARALYQRAAGADYPPAMFNLADLLRGGSAEERAQRCFISAPACAMNARSRLWRSGWALALRRHAKTPARSLKQHDAPARRFDPRNELAFDL